MSNENTSLVTFMDGAHPLKENATVVSLLHPHTNDLQHFIVSEKNIYEMNSMARPYGSFFLGSRVISHGALHVVTRMDPLYFVLHALSTTTDTQQQQQQQWQPLNQLDIDSVVQEALVHDLEQYKHVCAVKKLGDDFMLYKFSPKQAMKWLVQKQEAVLHIVQQQLLRAKQESKESTQQLISQGGGAFSNTFHMVPEEDNDKNDNNNNNNNNNNKDNGESLLTSMEMQAAKEASVEIVCEYLSLEWQTKLLSHLQMTTLVDNKEDSNNNTSTLKRSRECWETTTTPGQDDADNLLQFTMGITANGSSNAKEEALTLAAKKNKAQQAKTVGLKRLAKVNTKGMKSLSSFFGAPKQTKNTTSKTAAPAVKE